MVFQLYHLMRVRWLLVLLEDSIVTLQYIQPLLLMVFQLYHPQLVRWLLLLLEDYYR